jgi:hypothetical protein
MTGYMLIRPSGEEYPADKMQIVAHPTRSGNHRVLTEAI